MPAVTLRPLPLPEFHLLRRPSAEGAHRPGARGGAPRPGDFFLETTAEAVKAFGSGVAPTRFQFHFIGLVERSAAACTTGLASFRTGTGCAFFVPPEQIHSSRGWSVRDRGFALSFSEAFFAEDLADKGVLRRSPLFQWDLPPFVRLSRRTFAEVSDVFRQLAAEWARRPDHSPTALRLLLQLAVERLEREVCGCRAGEAPLDGNAQLYQRFRTLLEESFRVEKSPSAYAARLGVHPNHFASAVRVASGLPPGEWIRARVVLEAQCLLANTARAVKEIAGELGYVDEAYFSRLFKKAAGVSPREYQLGAGA